MINIVLKVCSGEKRAEVKAANPDYKIGEIAKVIGDLCTLDNFAYL